MTLTLAATWPFAAFRRAPRAGARSSPHRGIDPAGLRQALRLLEAALVLADDATRARGPWKALLLANPIGREALHVRWRLEDGQGAQYDPPFVLHHAAVHLVVPATDLRWADIRHSGRPDIVDGFTLSVTDTAHDRLVAASRLAAARDRVHSAVPDPEASETAFRSMAERFRRVHGFRGILDISA